jgi:hypothetical protein
MQTLFWRKAEQHAQMVDFQLCKDVCKSNRSQTMGVLGLLSLQVFVIIHQEKYHRNVKKECFIPTTTGIITFKTVKFCEDCLRT